MSRPAYKVHHKGVAKAVENAKGDMIKKSKYITYGRIYPEWNGIDDILVQSSDGQWYRCKVDALDKGPKEACKPDPNAQTKWLAEKKLADQKLEEKRLEQLRRDEEKKVNEQRKHEESLESIRKRTAFWVQRQKRPIEESVIATRVKASLVCDLLNNSRFNKYHNQTSFSFNAAEGTVFMKTLCDCTDADEPLEKPLVDVDALQRDICSFFGLSADTNSFMATKLAEGTHFSIGRAVVDQIMGVWVSRMLNTTIDLSEYSNNRRFSYTVMKELLRQPPLTGVLTDTIKKIKTP